MVYPEYTGPLMRWMDRGSFRDQAPPALMEAFREAPDVSQSYLPLLDHFQAHRDRRLALLGT